jgi:type I restriction enzyme S subunit
MFGDPIINTLNLPITEVINVVKMQRGFDLPIQNRVSDGNIPVFGSNGILGYHNEMKKEKGIITGRSGTLGEVYSCEGPFWPLNTTLFSVDTHNNNVEYLKYLLQFYDLKRFGAGAGVPTLNRNEFHNKQIIDVPIQKQNEFAEFVKLIDKSKFIVQQQIKDLQELLDKKMDEYFN